MPEKNPGVWGWPQGALRAQLVKMEIANLTIFAIRLLPLIKTVADPFVVRHCGMLASRLLRPIQFHG